VSEPIFGGGALSGEQFIGVDVGGTKVAAARLADGELADYRVSETERSADALIEEIALAVEAASTAEVTAVGVGIPSIVDFATGAARTSVNVPLAEVPLRRVLGERLGLPVYVDNDATLAALAEASEGGEVVIQNLVMLTVGTGLGGGLVLNGRPYRGRTGAAGEIGHTVVGLELSHGAPGTAASFPQPGSLESLAAGTALDRLAADAARETPDSTLGRLGAEGRKVTGHDAAAAARSGDEVALAAFTVFGQRLGIGIANAINTFDPDVVAIGGGVSEVGDLFLRTAIETARDYTLPGVGTGTEIRLARQGARAGVLGAALLAMHEQRTA
jgi:glucokinase